MASNLRNKIDVVDFHAHILPGADHGSDSVETSLFQLKLASSHGVSRVIATPHFYPNTHTVDSYLSRRNAAYELLIPYLDENLPEIRLGAEVLICEGIERLPELNRLFIEGTNTLLLELPFASFSDEYCYSVSKLVSNGVDVVIAHADRYHEDDIERMIECGAKLQLNAISLNAIFPRKCMADWLMRDAVVALGSDIHNRDRRAYSDFVRAISRLGDRVDFIRSRSDAIWNLSKKYQK